MKRVVAAALIAALAAPAYAAADLSKATATLSAIEKDEAKRKTYCQMQDLLVKAEDAASKKDDATAKTLSDEAAAKSGALGEDFKASIGIEEIDAASTEGKAFFQALEALEKSCAKA